MKRALLWAPLAVFILFLIIFMTGLLSPEGLLVGISYTPWMHKEESSDD